jgi:hypothetical protein
MVEQRAQAAELVAAAFDRIDSPTVPGDHATAATIVRKQRRRVSGLRLLYYWQRVHRLEGRGGDVHELTIDAVGLVSPIMAAMSD